MPIRGIDVASYQADRPAMRGYSFVWVKATEGTGYVNPRMAKQAEAARAAGAVVGFYHFLHPGDTHAQVAHFLSATPEQPGDMFACDWETPPSGVPATCAEKDQFIGTLKSATRVPHRTLLYCNRDFWLNRDTTSECGDGLWIADPTTAGHPRVQHQWAFHQYSVSGGTDQNVGRFSSLSALKTWAQA